MSPQKPGPLAPLRWELVSGHRLQSISSMTWVVGASHCGESLRSERIQALSDALAAHCKDGACLCVGRIADGALGAAMVLLPAADAWRVAPSGSGSPAWVVPRLSAATDVFGVLPLEVKCIRASALSPSESREAEAVAPAGLLRSDARKPAFRESGRLELTIFRDHRTRTRHLAIAPLAAWWARRASTSKVPASTSPRLRTRTMRVAEADAKVLALFDAPGRASVQYGSAWLLNFAGTVHVEGVEPWLHVLLDDEAPLAVLPLLHFAAEDAGGSRLEAMANYYTGVWAPALADGVGVPELRVLLDHVHRSCPAARVLSLAPMDGARPEYAVVLRAMRSCGWVVHEQVCFGNWYLPATGLNWASYLKGRSAGLRSTLKRLGTKFQAEGGHIELITGGSRLQAGIEAYDAVYQRSWKVPEPHVHFMPGLIRACADRGWLRLGIAWMGEQPVAAQLWIVAHGRAVIFKVGYDEAYARFSVGSLLTGFLMQHVLDVDHVDEVDYLIGDDAYKKTWMMARRERWALVGYAPWTAYGLYRTLRTAAGALWRSWQGGRRTGQAEPPAGGEARKAAVRQGADQ